MEGKSSKRKLISSYEVELTRQFLGLWLEVCLKCGKRFYAPDTVRKFDEIRRKLEREELEGLVLIGKTFKVA